MNTVDLLVDIARGINFEYKYFSSGYLSQACTYSFTVNGILYRTAEHYMQAKKAELFNVSPKAILRSKTAADAMLLGNRVEIDNAIWSEKRYSIIKTGNIHKFEQCENIKNTLIRTQNIVLVQLTDDLLFGIGTSVVDQNIANPTNWIGLNLLGFILMDVRATIIKNIKLNYFNNSDTIYYKSDIPPDLVLSAITTDNQYWC